MRSSWIKSVADRTTAAAPAPGFLGQGFGCVVVGRDRSPAGRRLKREVEVEESGKW